VALRTFRALSHASWLPSRRAREVISSRPIVPMLAKASPRKPYVIVLGFDVA
jgi:hypothetical protein